MINEVNDWYIIFLPLKLEILREPYVVYTLLLIIYTILDLLLLAFYTNLWNDLYSFTKSANPELVLHHWSVEP